MNRPPVSYHNQPVPPSRRTTLRRHPSTTSATSGRAPPPVRGPPLATCGPGTRSPFTIGANPTGELFVRNDRLGDALPLPVRPTDGLDTVARAVAEIVGHLY